MADIGMASAELDVLLRWHVEEAIKASRNLDSRRVTLFVMRLKELLDELDRRHAEQVGLANKQIGNA